jgi:putative membrane protein
MPSPGLSAADVEAVRRAVAAAESTSAGDIVPYVVAASDHYASATWKAVALGAMSGPLVAWAAERQWGLWSTTAFAWMVLPAAAGGALGLLVVHFFPRLRRLLAGRAMLEARTTQRAAAAFLEQEVFRTAGRTGILLFLSLFERRVVVLADSGIHARVGEREWERISAGVVAGIRAGDVGDALVEAIGECGALLVQHGLRRSPGQPSELAADLRQGEPS